MSDNIGKFVTDRTTELKQGISLAVLERVAEFHSATGLSVDHISVHLEKAYGIGGPANVVAACIDVDIKA